MPQIPTQLPARLTVPALFSNFTLGGVPTPMNVVSSQQLPDYVARAKEGAEMIGSMIENRRKAAEAGVSAHIAAVVNQQAKGQIALLKQIDQGKWSDGTPWDEATKAKWRNIVLGQGGMGWGAGGGYYQPLSYMEMLYRMHPEWAQNPPAGGAPTNQYPPFNQPNPNAPTPPASKTEGPKPKAPINGSEKKSDGSGGGGDDYYGSGLGFIDNNSGLNLASAPLQQDQEEEELPVARFA